jgi:ubiquinone/menaquinone biosynthesis C-methylase UbiE
MWKWFRRSTLDPLSVSMAGAKLGDRLLIVGCSDPDLIARLGAKAGLTGRACAVDESPQLVAEAERIALREGVLIEAAAAPYATLPFDAAAFDLVVVRDVLPTLTSDARRVAVTEAQRVMRAGGRCLVIETTAHGGLGSLVGSSRPNDEYGASGGALSVLSAAGFVAVRTLAEREHLLFVEAVKRNV